jgi:1,4-dihydroxy-6-naphthoate synthase
MNNSEITLGFSPCPNDCFIFDAMIHGKIDTEGLKFNVVMEDVEALNKKAFNKELDITKLSFYAFAHLTKFYQLLNSGSALGKGCGPILITNYQLPITDYKICNLQSAICNYKIAIPGKYTTANFLLSLAFPEANNKVEMLFSNIEDAVLTGKIDAGLIIHENRFTYEQKGFKKIIDLGEYWETTTNAPIPLGGIVVKRAMSDELKLKIDRVLRKSIAFAFANPKSSSNFVKANAQEMSEEVMYKHIHLYVNDYSINLGEEGKKAIEILFNKAQGLGLINKIEEDIFCPPSLPKGRNKVLAKKNN